MTIAELIKELKKYDARLDVNLYVGIDAKSDNIRTREIIGIGTNQEQTFAFIYCNPLQSRRRFSR